MSIALAVACKHVERLADGSATLRVTLRVTLEQRLGSEAGRLQSNHIGLALLGSLRSDNNPDNYRNIVWQIATLQGFVVSDRIPTYFSTADVTLSVTLLPSGLS